MRAQLAAAVAPGFITRTGAAAPARPHPAAAGARGAGRTGRDAAGRDRERLAEIRELRTEVDRAVGGLPAERRSDPDVRALHGLLDEYRVALFAQPMRTSVPVSAKRIRAASAALRH